MDFVFLVILLAILGETSFLVASNKIVRRGGRRKIYVDTSVLIDGRIIGIAESGFLEGDLIILKSVLRELQLLADGKEPDRRSKARNGLENASALERVENVSSEIVDDLTDGVRVKVDEQLLKYARENHGVVLTLDFNLIKVAEAEGVPALNINRLAMAVRTEFVEGERVWLRITDKGSNKGQGIGHLHNGTMVVVDKAAKLVGRDILVELVRFHETSAGKLIFARQVKNETETERKKI